MSTAANDHFETYFAEKLWEMIPAIYRHEDGLGDNPGVLRALVEVLAEQAALLRRSQDRLWEDQFIELCSDWAIPYIADLLGTRLVSAHNRRGRRVDVAKTIYYRRRKGTLRVLEELIRDIAGWDGKVVENFRRLARSRHGLDPQPEALAGRWSQNLPGGWAGLRQPGTAELAGGPFDEYFHAPDVRRHRGQSGCYNIPKLAFHLYRLRPFEIREATPFYAASTDTFTFDPSGRRSPLFLPGKRPENLEDWHSAFEWELPAPLRCRLLAQAEYRLNEAIVQLLADQHGLLPETAEALRRLSGQLFRTEARLRATLQSSPHTTAVMDPAIYKDLLRYSLIVQCAKKVLLPQRPDDVAPLMADLGGPAGHVTAENIAVGRLDGGVASAGAGQQLMIDPEQGLFRFMESMPGRPLSVTYHYGFSGPLGAGPFDRRAVEDCEPEQHIGNGGIIHAGGILKEGVTQIDDSKTYQAGEDILDIENLTLQAANQQRPYLIIDQDWSFVAANKPDVELALDGLWIGTKTSDDLILDGEFECVVLRHCTLDPGGSRRIDGQDIPALPLTIKGRIEKLVIDACITGPIRTQGEGHVEQLIIRDSILQSLDENQPALAIAGKEVQLDRTTLFGGLEVHGLKANEALATGIATVADTQNGCFRFGAAPAGSRLPRPYESFLFKTDARHWFTSRRFGDSGYAQLSETAPVELRRGAENGSEIGSFSSLNNPIKLDSLRAKVDEYMPFGLIPIFIFET